MSTSNSAISDGITKANIAPNAMVAWLKATGHEGVHDAPNGATTWTFEDNSKIIVSGLDVLISASPLEESKQSDTPISLTDLCNIIDTYRFRYATEKDLQDGIEEAFRKNGINYRREESISKANRPDFLVGGIAVEVKTKGSLSALLRQIDRYAAHDDVDCILVVGTPRWIHAIPQSLGEKEIHSLRLIGSLL